MVITKEILSGLKEIHKTAMKLVNEESKNDPISDPYRSHYAARDILLQMKDNLRDVMDVELTGIEEEEQFTYKIIQSYVCRDLGKIYVFTEERTTGKKYMKECLELVTEHKMKPEAIIPYISGLNELGIIYAYVKEHKKALDVLVKAETDFQDFKDSYQDALSINDMFGTSEEAEKGKGPAELESVYTLCTFYLAQVFGHLGDLEKSAKYCHKTLRRQMASKTYEPIDFALNAATLSQYYIGQNMFKEARHHLGAATWVMAEHQAVMLKPGMKEKQREDITETFKHRHADVARCWAKYGLALLSASKERLLKDDEAKLNTDTKLLNLDPENYRFPELELAPYENRVSADYCLTFDDAKLVYHFIISWLDEAKAYYKAEYEATEYSKIIKDFAELYQYMAFFEEDPVNQAKMQKRRAKYYEELLECLNPVFYMSICRECWYGAGLAQCAILDIKLDAVKAKRSPSPQELYKVNQICQKAIQHFIDFVESYMERDGITIKSGLSADEQITVLYAFFHMGRLYYKIITPDHEMQLENIQNSLKYYKLFTCECAMREEAAKGLQAEIGVAKEMVNLLPLKIGNLKKRMRK